MKYLLHLTALSLVSAETKLRGKKRNVLNLEEEVHFWTNVRNLQMSLPSNYQGGSSGGDGDSGIPPPAGGVPTPMPTGIGGGSAFPTASGGGIASSLPTLSGGVSSLFPTSLGTGASSVSGTGGGVSAFPTAGGGVNGSTSSFPTSGSINGAASSFPTSIGSAISTAGGTGSGGATTFPTAGGVGMNSISSFPTASSINGAASSFPTAGVVLASEEFACPPADFVGCTAPNPNEPVDECTVVGQACEGGLGGEYCCQDACPRNYCTAKGAIEK